MANGKIESYEELEDVFLKVTFSSYKPGRFAGLVYGTLKRLRESGVSAGKLDDLLARAGVKAPGNLARYIRTGEERNRTEWKGDEYALEHYLGMKPEEWQPRVVEGLMAAQNRMEENGNE